MPQQTKSEIKVAELRNKLENEIWNPGEYRFTCFADQYGNGTIHYYGEIDEPYWMYANAKTSFEASDEFVNEVLNNHLKLHKYNIPHLLEELRP